MTARLHAEQLAILKDAEVGDEIEVVAGENRKARRVIVTSTDDHGVYTTSGHVRARGRRLPGLKGGRIWSYSWEDGLLYQPTISQKVQRVSLIRIVRRARSRN